MSWNERMRFAAVFLSGLFAISGLLYLFYHAANIAKKINDRSAKPHDLLFQRQLINPAWRTTEINEIISKDPELDLYVTKIERQKYFFIAAMWLCGLIVASLFVVQR